MSRRIVWILLTLLVVVRLPSLVQPAGADQDLYTYVGQEITRGGLPFRDAWDQKPPAIHYTYALLFSLWPNESVVAAADLAAAVAVALLLIALERRVAGSPGFAGAAIFLLLGNPVYSRLGGMWLRAQCETFIALAVTAALLLLSLAVPASAAVPRVRTWALRLGAGVLLGVAIAFKYNAAAYGLVAIVAAIAWRHRARQEQPHWAREAALDGAGLAAGAIVPLGVIAVSFMAAGAWADLWDATITYNVRYSGETYRGLPDIMRYAVTFPLQQARVDGLWLLGGAGCLLLLTRIRRDPGALIVVAWVASACLAIVINGSRGLPQYFVQANPALAMAAGLGAWTLVRAVKSKWAVAAVVVVAMLALSRVVPARKAVEATFLDLRHMAGLLPREDYLARFGGQRATDKHVPVAVGRLAEYLRRHSTPSDTVFVFGFSQGALVQSHRRSASRFFWSRPVIVGFNEGRPGYGAAGLLQELTAAKPAVVALQVNDWQMEGTDSARYFMAHPALASWLETGYVRQPDQDNFRIWLRRSS
jgi:hypothetical protein